VPFERIPGHTEPARIGNPGNRDANDCAASRLWWKKASQTCELAILRLQGFSATVQPKNAWVMNLTVIIALTLLVGSKRSRRWGRGEPVASSREPHMQGGACERRDMRARSLSGDNADEITPEEPCVRP
jgi:hypothetical protein